MSLKKSGNQAFQMLEDPGKGKTGKENSGNGNGDSESDAGAISKRIQELMKKSLEELEVLGEIVRSNAKAVEINAASIKDSEKSVKSLKASKSTPAKGNDGAAGDDRGHGDSGRRKKEEGGELLYPLSTKNSFSALTSKHMKKKAKQ